MCSDTRLVRFRKWITKCSAPDPSPFHWKAFKRRHPGTGRWFLDNDRYTSWQSEPNSLIWVSGIPGCGKSVLSSSIIADIEASCTQDPDKMFAYFYFDFNDLKMQDPDGMVKSLVTQLFLHCIKISADLEAHYRSCADGQQQPSPAVWLSVLRMLINEFPETYIIIDALDECSDRKELLLILTTMVNWKLDNLHILVTSRPEHDIETTLCALLRKENIVRLRSELVDEDIRVVVRHSLSQSKWRKYVDMCDGIEKELIEKSQGM